MLNRLGKYEPSITIRSRPNFADESVMQTVTPQTSKEWKKFRKRLLINPPFQYSFMRYFVGIAAVTIAVFYAAKAFFFYEVQGYLKGMGFSPDHVLYDYLSRQSRLMDGIFAIAAIMEVGFLGWMGLRISHRVAGPLHRLKIEMLRTARGGEVTHLKFRDGDYFEDLAGAYNEQMEEVQKRANRTTGELKSAG